MCSDQDIGWFITSTKYLNESDLSIGVEFTLRETSFTSLTFRELPKITKLHLEIFRDNGLYYSKTNWKLSVAKSEFNLLSRSNRSVDE